MSVQQQAPNPIAIQALDFAPGILAIELRPPTPLAGVTLKVLLAFTAIALTWACIGRLDIIAVAQGKLVPTSYLQIVQPAESGIVKEILVKEGDTVQAGQVLARMDANLANADAKTIAAELATRRIQIRRVDAELAGVPLQQRATDPSELFAQAQAQYHARRQAYLDAIASEEATMKKATQDLRAATEIETKLSKTLPIYQEQEQAWDKLAKDGYAGRLMALDKQKDRVEREQEMKAQQANIDAASATIEQSRTRITALGSNYRQQLQNERTEAHAAIQKLEQDQAKQDHKTALLELKAPQSGVVKDLATHTKGSVLQPGTVLMSLVPTGDQLQAEVWVEHDDVGFVREGKPAKVKLAAYPFQKYGMLEATVKQVSPDAGEASPSGASMNTNNAKASPQQAGGYKALVVLNAQQLDVNGEHFALQPGMQVSAEINLGTRTVIEYLLSPVQREVGEAGRER
jgi:hemolysin D